MGMTERVEQKLIDSYIARGYWRDRTLGDFVQDCAKRWSGVPHSGVTARWPEAS